MMYADIELWRQKEIVAVASSRRVKRRLSSWQIEKIESFAIVLDKKNKQLTEQQLFFMRGIEETLIKLGFLE